MVFKDKLKEKRLESGLTQAELAKKAGVKTGMVTWEARQLCPELIVVPPQYEQYLKYSRLTRAIYQRYTDLIEPFGMDECWLQLCGSGAADGGSRTRSGTPCARSSA